MRVFIAAIDFVKFSSKSELSSRFFDRLKFATEKKNVFDHKKTWTENKRGRRTSVDGEQAWTENKRGILKKVSPLRGTTGVDLNKCGLEQGVDLNKAWT